MEKSDIKKKIQLAIDSVVDVPELFKTKAFEIILSNLLTEPFAKETSTPVHTETKHTGRKASMEENIERFAKITNIEVNQLKDIFHFEEKEPTFIGRVEGTEAEKQTQISQLILLSSQEVYGHEWVKGSLLLKILDDYGVGSLGNLARNLERRGNEIRAMGQGKGRQYKLTEQGKLNTIEQLRRLAVQ